MSDNDLYDFSKRLIREAETDCAEHDPGMVDAAAMVLVGDTYALLVCHGGEPPRERRALEAFERENGLSPFIR